MKRFRYWLIRQFLPRYAHELLLDEMAQDKQKLLAAQRTIKEQQRYIAGLEFALRQLRGVGSMCAAMVTENEIDDSKA